jgi:hypothetical protein
MENNYKFAQMTNKEELLQQITNLEKELTKKIGNDIVLIAYTPQKDH